MRKCWLRAEISACKNRPVIDFEKKPPSVFFDKTTCCATTRRRPALPMGSADGPRFCAHADAPFAWWTWYLALLEGAKCTVFHTCQGGAALRMIETPNCSKMHVNVLARSPRRQRTLGGRQASAGCGSSGGPFLTVWPTLGKVSVRSL